MPKSTKHAGSVGRRSVELWRIAAALIGVSLLIGTVAVFAYEADAIGRSAARQRSLTPFYTPPPIQRGSRPGTLLRVEPMPYLSVRGGTAARILYVSDQAGRPSVSSGMVFTPSAPPPAGGRPVLAWAHGTLGQGDPCVPSRSAKPTNGFKWVEQALAAGWVVSATDYSGLGTPGPASYLIGTDEAHDVLNAVRAARQVPNSTAGSRFVVYGHSQGGHASLWTADLARSYAPELTLVAAAAAAPATELVDLVHLQWRSPVAWAIGPPIVEDWPRYYPSLRPTTVLTGAGKRNAARIANECISLAAAEGLIRQRVFNEHLFTQDPSVLPAWRAALAEQQPPAPDVPTLIAQGTTDPVILPATTARYIAAACRSGAPLSQLWLGGVGHMKAGNTAGPAVVQWLQERLAGIPTARNCELQPPVQPYRR
ncbi:MAG: lipase family protein [Actinomycetes bacterium]